MKKRIGWKKAYLRIDVERKITSPVWGLVSKFYSVPVVVKLQILGQVVRPRQTVRIGNKSVSKFRTDKAKVLKMFVNHKQYPHCRSVRISHGEKYKGKISAYAAGDYRYYVGKICKPDKFDRNVNNGCSHGIHFFDKMSHAVNY